MKNESPALNMELVKVFCSRDPWHVREKIQNVVWKLFRTVKLDDNFYNLKTENVHNVRRSFRR